MAITSKQRDRARKLLAEIFYEDETFLDQLFRDLNERDQALFAKVADFGLDLIVQSVIVQSGGPDPSVEDLATLVRGKGGLNDAIRSFKKSYKSL